MSDDIGPQILAAIGRLDTRIERIEERFERIESRMDRLEAGHERLSANQTQLRVELMDRLQDTVTELREEVLVGLGRSEHTQRMTDNVRDEMRFLNETVGIVLRRVSRLESNVRVLRGEPP